MAHHVEANTPCLSQGFDRTLAVVIALLLGLCLSGTLTRASEPRPVRPFYNHFTTEDEEKLGAALARKIEADGIPVSSRNGGQQIARIRRNVPLESYLESVGSRLAAASQRRELHYSVRVLEAPDVVNAFSIPGGHIYITSKLLGFVQSESELAAVLGHEIGHVVAGHASNRIARVSLITLLIDQARSFRLISDDVTAQRLADIAMPILFEVDARTFYSRDDETEADLLALYELVHAGWDPEGEISLLTRLASASPDQSVLLALIATHPRPSDRLSVVREECRIANFPTGLKRDSSGFKAMQYAMHGAEDGRPWPWQYILPMSAALGCAAVVCVLLYLRKRF